MEFAWHINKNTSITASQAKHFIGIVGCVFRFGSSATYFSLLVCFCFVAFAPVINVVHVLNVNAKWWDNGIWYSCVCGIQLKIKLQQNNAQRDKKRGKKWTKRTQKKTNNKMVRRKITASVHIHAHTCTCRTSTNNPLRKFAFEQIIVNHVLSFNITCSYDNQPNQPTNQPTTLTQLAACVQHYGKGYKLWFVTLNESGTNKLQNVYMCTEWFGRRFIK